VPVKASNEIVHRFQEILRMDRCCHMEHLIRFNEEVYFAMQAAYNYYNDNQ